MDDKTISISVWLQPSKLRLNFCMICREDLKFQIEGYPKLIIVGTDASTNVEEYRALQYPIKVRCKGKSERYGRCPALWIIQGILD